MGGAVEINAEAKNTIKSSFTPLLVREDLALQTMFVLGGAILKLIYVKLSPGWLIQIFCYFPVYDK